MFLRQKVRELEERIAQLEKAQTVYLPAYKSGFVMEVREVPVQKVVQGIAMEFDVKLELGATDKVMKKEESDE